MKRIPFYKLSGLFLNVLLLTIAFTSCTKKTTEIGQNVSSEEFATAPGGNKPATSTEVRLKLTVNNASGNQITSDGGGSYIDGQENCSIYFSTSGNLQFTTSASNNPKTPSTRYLNINFDSPLPNYPARSVEQSRFISTITTVTSPNPTLLQDLSVGQTKCIGFSAGISTIADGVLNFHRNSTEDTPTSPTAYVYVTRTSSTEWLMTPVPPLSGGCSTIPNVGALRINTALYGYYNMPFSFTLTKL